MHFDSDLLLRYNEKHWKICGNPHEKEIAVSLLYGMQYFIFQYIVSHHRGITSLKNLRIRNKLILGFSIILALMLCSTLLSFQSLNTVYSQIERYRDDALPNTVRLWTIRRYNVSLQRYMALLSVSTDEQQKESYFAKIDSEQAGLEKEMAEFKLTSGASEEIFSRLDAILTVNDACQTKLVGLAKEATPEAAETARTVLLEEYVPNAVQMGDVINDAAKAISTRMEELNQQANDTKAISTALLFGSLAISIGMCSIIILLITRSIANPAKQIEAVYEEVANGNMKTLVEYQSKDELGRMADSIRTANVRLSSYIEDISEKLTLLSQGNMRFTVDLDYVGDFAAIKRALTDTAAALSRTMGAINNSAEQVNSGAEQVSGASQALASGAAEQAATVEQLNASIISVAQQAEQNANNVQKAMEHVGQAASGVNEGTAHMQKLMGAMTEISESSEKISSITKVIEDIAFQTNILALNAAIEAARAGSAGKGFAVVADEVRNLAAKSAEAAKQTAALIQHSTLAVSEGGKLADEASGILEDVAEKSMLVEKAIQEIDDASMEQAKAIEQINQGLSQVSAVVQTNAATAEESSASSEELAAQAQTLRGEVSRFQLSETSEGAFLTEPGAAFTLKRNDVPVDETSAPEQTEKY